MQHSTTLPAFETPAQAREWVKNRGLRATLWLAGYKAGNLAFWAFNNAGRTFANLPADYIATRGGDPANYGF